MPRTPRIPRPKKADPAPTEQPAPAVEPTSIEPTPFVPTAAPTLTDSQATNGVFALRLASEALALYKPGTIEWMALFRDLHSKADYYRAGVMQALLDREAREPLLSALDSIRALAMAVPAILSIPSPRKLSLEAQYELQEAIEAAQSSMQERLGLTEADVREQQESARRGGLPDGDMPRMPEEWRAIAQATNAVMGPMVRQATIPPAASSSPPTHMPRRAQRPRNGRLSDR